MKSPCINKCTTTSLSADLICKGCGRTDEERERWGGMNHVQQNVTLTLCEYRLKHYIECHNEMERTYNDRK